jgi:F-type H+/Na+-transporting ATPase subunit alpha
VTDVQIKGKIERGQRIRAILSQVQYASLRLVDEVALALALQGGLLDRLPLEDMGKFRSELPAWLDRSAAQIVAEIEQTGCLDEAKSVEMMTSLAVLVSRLAPFIETRPRTN